MAFEWANDVIQNDLELLTGQSVMTLLLPPLHVHLYSARTAPPSRGSVIGNFTLLDDPPDGGYFAQPLLAWTTVFFDALTFHYKADSNTLVWNNTSGAAWTPFLGYIITDVGDTKFLGGEELPAPFTLLAGLSYTRIITAQNINEY